MCAIAAPPNATQGGAHALSCLAPLRRVKAKKCVCRLYGPIFPLASPHQ